MSLTLDYRKRKRISGSGIASTKWSNARASRRNWFANEFLYRLCEIWHHFLSLLYISIVLDTFLISLLTLSACWGLWPGNGNPSIGLHLVHSKLILLFRHDYWKGREIFFTIIQPVQIYQYFDLEYSSKFSVPSNIGGFDFGRGEYECIPLSFLLTLEFGYL